MSRWPWLTLAIAVSSVARASPAPVLGPELDVDRPVLVGAVGEQTVAAAAWDGERFLAAWRSTLWKPELRVGRVTAAGQVQDPRGLLLEEFERIEGKVAVAAGGGGFLVVWDNEPGKIRAARVTVAGGQLVAGNAMTLTERPVTTVMAGPAVVWNGAGFWVLWGQNGDDAGVYAVRLSSDGQPQDAPVKLAPGDGEPALLWNGTLAVAGWAAPVAGGVEVRVARLRSDGAVLDPGGLAVLIVPGDTAVAPALAWDGSNHLVTGAALTAGALRLRGGRLAADWRLLDPGGFEVAAPPGMAVGGPTALARAGGFTVLWSTATQEGKRSVPRLSGSAIAGTTATPLPAFAFSQAGQMPFLAAGAEPFLFWSEVGWFTDEGLLVGLNVQAVPLAGSQPVLVSRGVNGQQQPVVALGGDKLLVAWEDRRADRQHGDIFAARLGTDGSMLDPDGIAVGAGPGPQVAPVVAWDGTHFLVAWRNGRLGLEIGWVGPDGKLLDRATVPDSTKPAWVSEPALCGDGDGALLVWGAPGALEALRLPRGGTLADGKRLTLAPTADTSDAPVVRLGCNQQAAVVVWSGHLQPMDKSPLAMVHLGRGRTAVTAPPQILQPSEGDEWAGIGSDGTDFLVAWRNFDGQGRRGVVGQRISADGRLLEDRPFRIGLSNSGQRVTTLWDGFQYLVFAINTAGGKPFDLRGRRVGRHGEPLDADWLPVAPLAQPWAGTGNGSDGVLLSPGRTLLVYDRYFDEDATGNIRIRARFIDSTAPDAPDAGVDAAPPDAAPADASSDAAVTSTSTGCSCQQTSGRPNLVLVLVLVLVLRVLLRRPERPQPRSRIHDLNQR